MCLELLELSLVLQSAVRLMAILRTLFADFQVGDRKVCSLANFNCSTEGSSNGWSIAAG